METAVLEEVTNGDDADNFLDFNKKYMSKGGKSASKSSGSTSAGMASTARRLPAPVSEEETELIQKYAKETFKVLGCSGVCRIDFLMDAETHHIYVNEINTIPGSLAFYLWEATGLSFSQLMDKLVQLALDRERRRSRMTFSYETNLLSNYSANGAKGAKGSKM